MAQTNINIRIDEGLKRDFDAFCNEVGMNMSTAFCIFAKTAVREQRIPFEVKGNVPNAETLQAMQEVDEMLKSGKGRKFNSVEELFEELNA